ncbi:hypothetical protein [Planomonospora venezuelensis]|uniref:Tetracycline repressor TetR C-terminal domain-containing protein n=1 Tax=Planomonospora venezuelensis TaxID=1999 RepID=A0A841DEV3_PLAVE|nr:hypothetical protein [Planomonospora venezuelensis]MBB5968009.1 hypothetical protein [Planomonospora venezuelensis]GIN02452.1 hypothetical protein Pve01_41100 [Planomonospora venezuelensis]
MLQEGADLLGLRDAELPVQTAIAGTQPWAAGQEPGSDMAELTARYAERFPALTAAIADARDTPHDNGWAFGLRFLLDGLGVLIEERAAAH